MKEKIFEDLNGESLIVRNRRSAVFFLRKTNKNVKGYVSKFWVGKDTTPIFDPKEMNRKYEFSDESFKEFVEYMKEIGYESWKTFNPKEASSAGSDYFEYYDRDHDNNGYLGVYKNTVKVEGPMQDRNEDLIARLYKFNKLKFEAFVYDLMQLK